MRRVNALKIFAFLLVTAYSGQLTALLSAQETKRVAVIAELSGTAEVKAAKENWKPAAVGMVLNEGDIIRTKKDSLVTLELDSLGETATVEVKESSQVRLAEMIIDKEEVYQKTLLDLALGGILIKAQKLHSEKSAFEVKTPTSVVAVRGTTFSVTVEAAE